MRLGGFQGWFDAPVVARFVSNANRIGANDVLTMINALMDWRWCLPNRKRGLGRAGIGPQGYDPLVLFKCLLIGQWHPKAGARALNCGWISYCVAAATSFVPVPDATTHCRSIAFFAMCWCRAVPMMIFCRTPQDRAETEAPDDMDQERLEDYAGLRR
ncbi:MAG: hypothetical protein GDA36_12120 [Rhodobacteraceae bacterium]|nr:hypothetical protein [Paracoccaceae bacterium]